MSWGLPVRNGLGVGILASTSLSTRKSTAFSPLSLFAAGEQGAWYDPSDLTTMFQDSAGTTPVTATGQTVGLLLDKSKGLVLGSELVSNGGFDTNTTGWTAFNSTLSVDSQRLKVSATTTGGAWQVITTVIGRRYSVTGRVEGLTAGDARVRASDGATYAGATLADSAVITGSGGANVSFSFVANSASSTVYLRLASAADCFFDNISVRELPGNHATQSVLASRPIYGIEPFGGRRNLLTYTEQFDNAAWSKSNATVTANAAVAPDGTPTADTLTATGTSNPAAFRSFSSGATAYTFSTYIKQGNTAFSEIELIDQGTSANRVRLTYATGVLSVVVGSPTGTATNVGNGWWRVTITYTFPAIGAADTLVVYPSTTTGVIGDFCFIWGAQLETGSTATAYQRVTDQWNVTQAGVPSVSYLQYDGSDDWFVTSTITPGTDKAQVFAGVRKLSDAARGLLMETGAAQVSSVRIESPPAITDGRYRWASYGTTEAIATTNDVFDAPITNVLTGIGDIAADTAILRVNGTQAATSTADQGTGNYLAYPLYIGRRAGTSLPFNGRLYGLITRFGANLTADQISQTETWVNSKTGAY